MKKLKLILGLALAALVAGQAQASFISGSISFDGTATLNGPITTATGFTSFTGVDVADLTQTGDYSGTDGSLVTMTGFDFDPFNGPVTPLWTFDYSGKTYSFDLNTITGVSRANFGGFDFLTVSGSGVANITGFSATNGSWALTTQSQSNSTTLSFSAASAVPDSGATAALLGLGLIGLAGAARRFKK